MSEKHRRAPGGEWLGYPILNLEDIEYESFKSTKYIVQSLVGNRKGRICLLMEHIFYQRFLGAVRKKFGNTSSSSIEKAAGEAVEMWIEGVQSK